MVTKMCVYCAPNIKSILTFAVTYDIINIRDIIIQSKGDRIMVYVKPSVINPEVVNMAKCGDGPCGRPCSNRA